MIYEKEKVTITLEKEEVHDFWEILMCALDYDRQARSSKKDGCPKLNASQLKLTNKLEEIVRPYYG